MLSLLHPHIHGRTLLEDLSQLGLHNIAQLHLSIEHPELLQQGSTLMATYKFNTAVNKDMVKLLELSSQYLVVEY